MGRVLVSEAEELWGGAGYRGMGRWGRQMEEVDGLMIV